MTDFLKRFFSSDVFIPHALGRLSNPHPTFEPGAGLPALHRPLRKNGGRGIP